MDREPGREQPASATISEALDELKHDGSSLLVVGSPNVGHKNVCERLLGHADDQSRYRLLVTDPDAAGLLGDSTGRNWMSDQVLEYSPSSAGTDQHNEDSSDAAGSSLTDIGSAIIEAIDTFETQSNGFDPGAVRVCVEPVSRLVSEHDNEHVFRFLHVTTSRIRQANGMGHYHLPVDRTDQIVHLFEPLFDAIVEVRSHDGVIEHRWEFLTRDVTSGWIEL